MLQVSVEAAASLPVASPVPGPGSSAAAGGLRREFSQGSCETQTLRPSPSPLPAHGPGCGPDTARGSAGWLEAQLSAQRIKTGGGRAGKESQEAPGRGALREVGSKGGFKPRVQPQADMLRSVPNC